MRGLHSPTLLLEAAHRGALGAVCVQLCFAQGGITRSRPGEQTLLLLQPFLLCCNGTSTCGREGGRD